MTNKTFKDYLKEDAIDQEKHDALNNIAMTLGALETEIQELQRLDGDMDSSGVGDLTDQLTTMRKLVDSFEAVIDRATGVVPMESRGTMETARPDRESKSDKAQQKEILRLQKMADLYFNNPNHRKKYRDSTMESVDQALIDSVVDQIMRDIEMGDQTAIEELLMSCPEDKLRGFLSEIDESADLNELKKLAGLPQLPKMTQPDDPVAAQPELPSLGAGFDPERGFLSAEEYAREMLKGIKGVPKPGTAEYEKLVRKITNPSLGGGFDPETGGFPKQDPRIDPRMLYDIPPSKYDGAGTTKDDPSLGAGFDPEKGFPKADPNADPSLGAGLDPEKGFAKGSDNPDLYMKGLSDLRRRAGIK